MKLFCADIGTSSIKAGVLLSDGMLLASARIPFPSGAGVSVSAEAWSAALVQAVRATGAGDVDGVVLSGQGPTIVPVDAAGTPLYEALSWNDARNLHIAGQPSFFLPKAAWFMRNRPELYLKTAAFLSCPEYLSYRLCGEMRSVVPSREFEPYFWTAEALETYGLDAGRFPPFVRTGELMGRVRDASAAWSGLPAGIPVVAGGSDFLMALLGTAAVVPGRTCDRAGTSEGINYCSAVPVNGDRIRCLPHAVEGYYNIAGILSSTGLLFEWFRKISGQSSRPYDAMLAEIEASALDAKTPLFFPTLHEGATWEFRQGLFFGLGAGHGPAEMGKAVVESIGFAVREAIEILESHTAPIKEIRVTGGQAKNAVWNQMKADMIGRTILVPLIEDAELLGDACAGFTGLGLFPSLEEASEALFRVKRVHEPRAALHEQYSERYGEYVQLYGNLRRGLRDEQGG